MHAIQDRPVAANGQVVIRPMMYVALTYDHRIVDGREAVTFLKRIKDVIEDADANAARGVSFAVKIECPPAATGGHCCFHRG